MNTSKDTQYVGLIRSRKPWTAANLSLLLAGLGQIYCGAFRRGITHMWMVCALVIACMVVVAMEVTHSVSYLAVAGIGGLILTIYSGWDAYCSARRTRPDYRLKEYNRAGVYAAFLLMFFATAVGCAFIVRANLLHAFVIVGESMSPTFREGQHVLVRKDAFRQGDPEREDLVAFLNPSDRRQHWIKRVVGLPGDEIEVRDGAILINGEPREGAEGLEDVGPLIVPENHCYVLGDNPAHSKDSRQIGAIPLIALVGKVVFAY